MGVKSDLSEQLKVLGNLAESIRSKLVSIVAAVASLTDLKRTRIFLEWLITYIDYVEGEKGFDDSEWPDLKRGDVVWVELGFNVGKEFGGSHPAVVLRDCKRGIDQILVLPFGSQKPKRELPIYVEFPNVIGLTGHVGTGLGDPDVGKHWANVLGVRNVSKIRVTYDNPTLRVDDRILDRISGAIVSQLALRSMKTTQMHKIRHL